MSLSARDQLQWEQSVLQGQEHRRAERRRKGKRRGRRRIMQDCFAVLMILVLGAAIFAFVEIMASTMGYGGY